MRSDLALLEAYRGRRVLVTGHTGFKGGWLALWLSQLDAQVFGYSLAPPTTPCLFEVARIGDLVTHFQGDVGDLVSFERAWDRARPDVVFHLAAQPVVIESYKDPITTLRTNVLGSAHVLELVRAAKHRPRAVVMITSDKCYENREWVYGYREGDALGGHDPYSASKAAAELVIDSYRRSFFQAGAKDSVAVASARAGNVIGGGDWALGRIVPDCMRAILAGTPATVRSPRSTRPWQHVLEPLSGYLTLGARLLTGSPGERRALSAPWNFGPQPGNAHTVSELVEGIVARWPGASWEDVSDPTRPHEAGLLALAIDKAQVQLGWSPRWDFPTTIRHTVDWYRAFAASEDMRERCLHQVREYVGATS